MRYAFIDARKAEFPVLRLCKVLRVSQSGYHAWKIRSAGGRHSPRLKSDQSMLVHVRAAFRASHETYGSPRLAHELKARGIAIGRRRTARLMRESGLCARKRRRFVRTTDSGHGLPFAPNLLAQDFSAAAANQKWASDITYVWTRQGWLYLAVVIDLYARRVVGWSASQRIDAALALAALKKALTLRPPSAGLIHHSDRGSQYCAYAYQVELSKHAIAVSMSGKGNAYDNAVAESFFKTLKTELVWRTSFQTRHEAVNAIAQYIDGFYNPSRRHSALGYLSPVQFERLAG